MALETKEDWKAYHLARLETGQVTILELKAQKAWLESGEFKASGRVPEWLQIMDVTIEVLAEIIEESEDASSGGSTAFDTGSA